MPTGTTRNRDQLRKRVSRFLEPTEPHRADAYETLRGLQVLGRVLVFGGAIRDLALYGNDTFPSDVDVVIENAEFERMEGHLGALGATRNRFGGFRFATSRWKFDVWRLEDTWALRHGHVHGSSGEVLLQTTFFDWDAIAYDFTERRLLVRDGYFEKLSAGMLGINLPANPNPRGNAKRALRIYASGRAGLEPDLAQFVAETTRSFWEGGSGPEAEREFPGLDAFLPDFLSAGGKPMPPRVSQMRLT